MYSITPYSAENLYAFVHFFRFCAIIGVDFCTEDTARRGADTERSTRPPTPWFVLGFVAVVAANSVFTGARIDVTGHPLPVGKILGDFPMALLINGNGNA